MNLHEKKKKKKISFLNTFTGKMKMQHDNIHYYNGDMYSKFHLLELNMLL